MKSPDDTTTAPPARGRPQEGSEMKRNEMIRIPLVLAILALLAAAPALAEEKVDLKGEAASDGTVHIENIAGSIVVKGWDRDEIAVTGTLGDDVERLDFETGRKSRVKVVYPKKSKNIREGADLEIMVPAGSDLEIECISADISVTGVRGEIEASAISGGVTIEGECEELEAESISGDVLVVGGAPEMQVGSISGSVEARGGRAEVEAETVSGGIELEFDEFLNLTVESVAGDATVRGALHEDASVEIELHSGDLVLVVPADVSADFGIETFSGDVDDAFGHEATKVSKYAPGKELEFTTGGGDARVRISTFSGKVTIKKM
jgi:DUF4097 and DUF4098 domain-containing protein YvlB